MLNPFVYHAAAEVTALQRARFKLVTDPQLLTVGALIATMEVTADESVGTACTDCIRKIKVAPSYLEKMEQIDSRLPISVFIHEAIHKKQGFFPRFERWAESYPNQDRQYLFDVFNIAADYMDNWEIRHRWGYPLHDTWYYRDDFTPDKYTTEGIANYLMQNPDEQPQIEQGQGQPCADGDGGKENTSGGAGDGGDGEAGDESGGDGEAGDGEESADAPTGEAGRGGDIELPEEYNGDINNKPTPQQLRDMEIETREDSAEALRMGKGARGAMCGDGKGASDPFQDDLAKQYYTAYDFRNALMQHANIAKNQGKLSWYRQNKCRRTSQGIPLPGRYSKALGTAIFVIDSSGSTSGPLVKYFLDETYAALRDLDYEKAVIIWCDRQVNHVDVITKQEADCKQSLWDGNMYGGGGTALAPAIAEVVENYKDARCITYLTDGAVYAKRIDAALEILRRDLPNVPTLWLLDNKNSRWAMEFRDYIVANGGTMNRCAFLPNEMLEHF